jgi:hypothetical protein
MDEVWYYCSVGMGVPRLPQTCVQSRSGRKEAGMLARH